jgi:hypothetical protein
MFSAKLDRWLEWGLDMLSGAGGARGEGEEFGIVCSGVSFFTMGFAAWSAISVCNGRQRGVGRGLYYNAG